MNSSRSLKRLLLAAMALLALPVSAFAQTSRVEAIHVQGDYIKDYTGIFTYTSGITNVGSLAYGELGNVNGSTTFDRGVGVVLGNLWDGNLGAWGIFLREETPQLGQGDAFSQPAPGAFGFDPNTHTNESFDIMWGKKFGTMSLGLRINRSYFRFQEDLAGVVTELEFDAPQGGDPNLTRNIMGFGAGVGFELNPNAAVEVNVLYQSRTFVNDDPPVDTENDGGATYQFAARMMWMYQPNWMIVPVFKWYNYDLSVTDNAAATSAEASLSGWQVGAASNWTLGANDLLVFGVTLAQNTVDDEGGPLGLGPDTKLTETFMPQLFAGLETHVNNWLTFRFGAEKGMFHTIETENSVAATSEEINDSPFSMTLGTGVKLGSLQLDAILSDIFPHTLGWLGSGIPGVYFPKVTATYAF